MITLGKKVSQSFFRNFYKNVFAPFCNLPCQKWDGSILVGCFSWSWQVMIANHFILHSLGLILLDLQMSNVHENTRLPTPDRVRESATAPSWTKMSSACNDNIFVRIVDKFWFICTFYIVYWSNVWLWGFMNDGGGHRSDESKHALTLRTAVWTFQGKGKFLC